MPFFMLIAAQASSAAPQRFPETFSPRDLYVSCSLAASDDRLLEGQVGDVVKAKAPATCAAASLKLWSTVNREPANSPLRFCPNGSADFDGNTVGSFATAYMRYYEENAVRLNQVSGYTAMILAFKEKWPCR